MPRTMWRCVLVLGWLAACAAARALPAAEGGELAAQLVRLLSEDSGERVAAIERLAASGEQRLIAFFEAYRQGAVAVHEDRPALVREAGSGRVQLLDPLSGQPLLAEPIASEGLRELPIGRRERLAANHALVRLRLADPDPKARLNAVSRAAEQAEPAARSALEALAQRDPEPRIRRMAAIGVAAIDLRDAEAAVRKAACQRLAELRAVGWRSALLELGQQDPDGAVREAARRARAEIEAWMQWTGIVQTLFSGLSAGSILIVMALGLSITFGLMGVINMAHGEMLMIGAYATLLTQWLFAAVFPAAMPWYFPCGIVAAFLSAALLGWLIELTLVRHLYGRPLETLLATWGVSYLLIQTIRVIFGDNQAVTAPDWLVGGWEPVPELVLPWNRLFIIGLTVAAVIAVWWLLARTRLGLLVRATTQSRRTAAALGVDTRRIDGATFALGSGLAGAAGAALTLIGGLKPDMGQEFIIDSFLVVAAGGVGNLAGVVLAGLGLGMANKLLEPLVHAVWAKVLVLAAIILFLQWRPSGLFPPRGRLADA
ncbi:MAG: urea ABC transporter permease subunit UrtB [Planctomycetota bacterium]|nr:urea ABC transporter permease subunit UrtB [Planctomycetota bacterium]MDW8372900.1 urea ABC transporter permease subunit UrtB [Planctomycetota bacterium]